MRLLIDTHVLLWQLADDQRFKKRWRTVLEDDATQIFVSDVSLWEIVVKVRTGRLSIDIEEVEEEVVAFGYLPLAIKRVHIRELKRLPLVHRDPFDHLLLAQARVEGLTMLSDDREFRRFDVALA